jgi:N-methylhydantoinase B
LSPYGVRGGKAALPYRAIVNPGTAEEKKLPGLVDDLPLRQGDLLRLMTTGGGGWGDPLEREPEYVLLDVIQGKVSSASAREDYGVVLAGEGDNLTVDGAATEQLRRERASLSGERELIDRGPGYTELLLSST